MDMKRFLFCLSLLLSVLTESGLPSQLHINI